MLRAGLVGAVLSSSVACASRPAEESGRAWPDVPPAKAATASASASTSGHLPPEVIHRVLRASFLAFQRCYLEGLGRNPDLTGRVDTAFVIGRDGTVEAASSSGSMPDKLVMDCVAGVIRGLTFPKPEGGIVKANYPLAFEPAPPEVPAAGSP